MPPKLSPPPAYSSNIEIYGDGESAALTPRTPYSRAGRAVEGDSDSKSNGPATPIDNATHNDEDTDDLDEIDILQTQSHPLLHSSTSESFPLQSRYGNHNERQTKGKWRKGSFWENIKAELKRRRIPVGLLLGCGTAAILLFLIIMSVKRHDALLEYMGVNTTAITFESLDEESKGRFNGSNVIDYSNYTSFPLSADQYLSECWKVRADPRMKYFVPYWKTRPGAELDVLHVVCTTIYFSCLYSYSFYFCH